VTEVNARECVILLAPWASKPLKGCDSSRLLVIDLCLVIRPDLPNCLDDGYGLGLVEIRHEHRGDEHGHVFCAGHELFVLRLELFVLLPELFVRLLELWFSAFSGSRSARALSRLASWNLSITSLIWRRESSKTASSAPWAFKNFSTSSA